MIGYVMDKCTGLCRLVVTGNRQKVQCVVYTATSFLFSPCCNSCFRYILIPSASDNQPAKCSMRGRGCD